MPESIQTEAPPADVCVHRWILEMPVGHVTHGTCRLCGVGRDFTDADGTSGYNSRPRRTR